MVKDNRILNRTRLVDEPIVEMLLTKKYGKSNVKFMKSSADPDCTDLICYGNGIVRSLNVKRNSSKYHSSPNFSIAINKNHLGVYNNASYVFIDEVADCLYIVDGMTLLTYILEHADNVRQSDNSAGNYYIVIPKKDVASLVNTNDNIVKYNKAVADLFANCRDESQYASLL